MNLEKYVINVKIKFMSGENVLFEVNINNNTRLALEVTEEYFKKIIEEPNEVKNYKMVILNLHNALELTFKLMIHSRNSFMVYSMQDSNSYGKLIQAFKKVRNSKDIVFRDENPFEDSLHTVSFKTAYEILAYLYQIEEFDDKFLFKLQKIENLRNALMHYKAYIEETDIILLYSMFEQCVELFNNEMKSDTYPPTIKKILKSEDYICFDLDYDLKFRLSENIENICFKILDRDIIKMLVSCLIKTIGYINDDIKLDDYQSLCEFFNSENKKGLKNIFKERNEEQISYDNFLLNNIYILLEANFLISKSYCDCFGVDVLGGISLNPVCKDIILKKYDHDKEKICSDFGLNENEYESFINMDKEYDYYSDN